MKLEDLADKDLLALDRAGALAEAALLVRGASVLVLTEATREDLELLARAGELLELRRIHRERRDPRKLRDALDGGAATLAELADLASDRVSADVERELSRGRGS